VIFRLLTASTGTGANQFVFETVIIVGLTLNFFKKWGRNHTPNTVSEGCFNVLITLSLRADEGGRAV
jgi:hypothetical protein